jgi:uncharacterized protein (TIGR03086 family)
MTVHATLEESHQILRDAVLGVSPDGWSHATPCGQWSVTQVLQHAAGDQQAWASTMTGEPGPSYDPFSPSGQLDESPVVVLDRTLQASTKAFASLGASPESPTPLPQGVLPIRVAVGACALDAAIHGWDIAVATGQASPLTPELARELMWVATQVVEPLRAWGAYGAIVEPGDATDEMAGLLQYLGRRPLWSPAG